MRRRNFLQAGSVAAFRPAALVAGAKFVATEGELHAAVASGAARVFFSRSIALTRVIQAPAHDIVLDLCGFALRVPL